MPESDAPSAPVPDYIGAFQAIDTPCALVDATGVVRDVNEAYLKSMAQQAGIGKADCIGRHLADFVPEGQREQAMADIEDALAEGRSFSIDCVINGDLGEDEMRQLQLQILTDCDGRVNGGLVTGKSHQGDRIQSVLQAHKMEAVGQLTAGIAHNFNNMLQGAVSNLELARLDAGDQIKPALDNALQATHRAAEMVQQLLMFSRQGMRSRHRTVDVVKVIRDTEAICLKTFDRKISFTVDWRPMPPTTGDSIQLQQVFLNLCINARDALEESNQPAPAIQLELETVQIKSAAEAYPDSQSGPYLVIRVSDNGAGMDEKTRERIFEPFFTTKSVDRGTGLGLSTAFGIVRDHKGWIGCDSNAGSGTRFSVFLPVAGPQLAETPADENPPPARGTEGILVVDDEEMVRNTARQMLELAGYSVYTAEDGAEALEICDRDDGDIDLVLLDQSMPHMSGRDVLRKLRETSPDLRIVMFTGFAANKEEFDGATGLLQKPFTMSDLVAVVRDALDNRD